jgi:hypothetical protein
MKFKGRSDLRALCLKQLLFVCQSCSRMYRMNFLFELEGFDVVFIISRIELVKGQWYYQNFACTQYRWPR